MSLLLGLRLPIMLIVTNILRAKFHGIFWQSQETIGFDDSSHLPQIQK
jgi:hypothetical protein